MRIAVVRNFLPVLAISLGTQFVRTGAAQRAPSPVGAEVAESSQYLPASLSTLWTADFETGDTSQWYFANRGDTGDARGGEFNSGIAWSNITAERVRTGKYSLKMNIFTPPESGVRLFRWHEPRNVRSLTYGVWYNFPRRYTVERYWNVLQWKSKRNDNDIDPFFILNVGNRADGTMFFYVYDWQRRRSYHQSVRNIVEDTWTNVQARYDCSGDSRGRLTLWQDGVLLFDIASVQTRYSDGDCQWGIGSYSDGIAPLPAYFYVDDVSIGDTADVQSPR